MKRVRFSILALTVLLGVGLLGFLLWRHPNGAKQFEYAFGIAPPSGVQNIEVSRYYAGGPGDAFTLLRFTADRAAIEESVAFRPFILDSEVVEFVFLPDNGLQRLWHSLFGGFAEYGGEAWEAPSQLNSPEVYKWHGAHSKLTGVILLWDAGTGEAFVLYTIG